MILPLVFLHESPANMHILDRTKKQDLSMRQRKIEIAMGVLLLLGAWFASVQGAKLVSNLKNQNTPVVLIDPGHGGEDPGVIGIDNIAEKDINLKIACLLKERLLGNGLGVVMTREKDIGLYQENERNHKVQDMQNRCKVIAEHKPDCTISIHQNSYPDASVYGPQVFYYTDSSEGKTLAAILQKTLNTQLKIEKPRVEKGNSSYYLLKRSEGVTVIVECGFLSNAKEAGLLTEENYQQQIAAAICAGVMEYLR